MGSRKKREEQVFRPYVVVEWEDAFNQAGWKRQGEVEDWRTPCVCFTAGFLVKRDRKGVTMAVSLNAEGHLGGLWHIPRGMVRKVTRLQEIRPKARGRKR